MANMSYCRWHNTNLDVADCFESFCDDQKMSKNEVYCAKDMIRNMCEFLMDTGVIEEYDYEVLFNEFDRLLKD